MDKFNEIIESAPSRRQFLAAAGVGAVMLAINPSKALAAVEGQEVIEKTADELWAEAVAKAEKNGDPVYYNQIPHSNPIPYGRQVRGFAQESTFVSGIYDYISAVAIYDVNDNNRIWKLYDAWAYGGSSEVEHSYYNYTIADGGRSLVINFVITLRNYIGVSQSFSLYTSFGASGSGYMAISYLN